MCGRFTLTRVDEVLTFFELNERPELEVRYNIAPSQDVLVVLPPAEGTRMARFMKWGLIPHFSRSSDLSSFINARSETVDRKLSFRDSFRSRRCLIPSDGFYEWRRERGFKQPFHFRLKDRELFSFAGLWDRRLNEAGESIETCTILTTPPNDLVAGMHDRMPAILDRSMLDLWLDAASSPARLKEMLGPFPSRQMEKVPVNPAVNRTDFDSPECLDPPPRRPRNLDLF